MHALKWNWSSCLSKFICLNVDVKCKQVIKLEFHRLGGVILCLHSDNKFTYFFSNFYKRKAVREISRNVQVSLYITRIIQEFSFSKILELVKRVWIFVNMMPEIRDYLYKCLQLQIMKWNLKLWEKHTQWVHLVWYNNDSNTHLNDKCSTCI